MDNQYSLDYKDDFDLDVHIIDDSTQHGIVCSVSNAGDRSECCITFEFSCSPPA
jgi:hypothetical protein